MAVDFRSWGRVSVLGLGCKVQDSCSWICQSEVSKVGMAGFLSQGVGILGSAMTMTIPCDCVAWAWERLQTNERNTDMGPQAVAEAAKRFRTIPTSVRPLSASHFPY